MDMRPQKLYPLQGIALLFLLIIIPIGIYFVSQKKPVTDMPPKAVDVCGGIRGIACSSGFTCDYGKNYGMPDASGMCVKITEKGVTDAGCVRAGCSGQLCKSENDGGGFSPCDWRDVYRCAQVADCKKQTDGSCKLVDNSRSTSCYSSLLTPTPISPLIKPEIVELFACGDYCPNPRESYLKKVYKDVTTKEECDRYGGEYSSYTGWGTRFFCIAIPTPTSTPTKIPTNTPTPTTYIAPTPTPIRVIVPRPRTTSTPTPTVLPMLLSDLLSSPTGTLLPVSDSTQPILTIDPFYNSKKQANPILSISGASNSEAKLDISIFPDGITTTVTADSLGNWEYALPNKLTNGDKQLTIISRTANGKQMTKMETFTVVGGDQFPFVTVIISMLIAFGIGGYFLYKKKMNKNQKPPPTIPPPETI